MFPTMWRSMSAAIIWSAFRVSRDGTQGAGQTGNAGLFAVPRKTGTTRRTPATPKRFVDCGTSWKEATGISWTTSPAQRDSGVQVTGPAALALQALSGAEVAAGTAGELNDLLRSLSQPVAGNTGSLSSPPVGLSLEMDTYLKTTGKDAGENGFEATEPWDWPTEVLAECAGPVRVRRLMGSGSPPRTTTGTSLPSTGPWITPRRSHQRWIRFLTGLVTTPTGSPSPRPLVEVVDGDTVALEFDASTDLAPALPAGARRGVSRLVGVNAAEVNTAQADYYAQQGVEPPWDQQTRMLTEILNHATTVDFVVFDTERFPTIQQVEGDEVRWLMVLLR